MTRTEELSTMVRHTQEDGDNCSAQMGVALQPAIQNYTVSYDKRFFAVKKNRRSAGPAAKYLLFRGQGAWQSRGGVPNRRAWTKHKGRLIGNFSCARKIFGLASSAELCQGSPFNYGYIRLYSRAPVSLGRG
jgi:hypothetical protein